MASATIDPHALALEVAELVRGEIAPPLLDAKGAAELLNVPPSWVLAQARKNRIPHVKLGHYTRFRREELLAWIAKRSEGRR